MKAQIGLVITAVAGATLLAYRRWKQRSLQESTEQTDRKETGSLTNPTSTVWILYHYNIPPS